MANLAKVLGIDLTKQSVILVGKPEKTNFTDHEDKPYYSIKLKNPVRVYCSMDPQIDSFETGEVYVRESALDSEDWSFVDEKKPEEGFFMEGWVVDFSQGQQLPLYQETSIKKWSREQRTDRKDNRRREINQTIKDRIKNK